MTAAYWDNPNYLYGNTARKYDEVPADFAYQRLEWRFEVAWEDPFCFFSESDGRTENTRAVDCYWNRGRGSFINYDGKGLTRYPPGRMVITLVNDDGRYDPNNTESILYPNIVPGKLCRLGVRMAGSTNLTASTSYVWRFTGKVKNIKAYEDENTQEKFVDITVECGWGFLLETDVYLPPDYLPDSATFMGKVLTAADWPHTWLDDLSGDTDYPAAWADGSDARTILHQLSEAVNGKVFIDGRGTLKYRTRDDSPDNTYEIAQGDLLRRMEINNPWENAINYVDLLFWPAILDSGPTTGSRWGDDDTNLSFWITFTTVLNEIQILAGETFILTGKYDAGTTNAIIHLINSNFGAFRDPYFVAYFGSAAGGAGSDVSGEVSVDYRDGGTTFTAFLKNNGSSTVYSRLLSVMANVRVNRLTANKNSLAVDQSDGKARNIFKVETPFLVSSTPFTNAELKDIANSYADDVIASGSKFVFNIEARPDIQFMDIQDHILFTLPKKNITGDQAIGMIEEKWLTPNGQAVLTTLYTEGPLEIISEGDFLELMGGGIFELMGGGRLKLNG